MIVAKQYKLISYRDAGLPTFTYFWINDQEKVCSPYFDSEQEAHSWMTTHGKLEYDTFEDYFNEIENYGTRGERFYEELNGMTAQRAVQWLRAVWDSARRTK